MKRVFFLLLFFLFTKTLTAQDEAFKLQSYRPVTPSAFEFSKYTEMPVSEYTGIPNISIPLYQIQEDGVSVPVVLTYHAGGIRINQEASWVGLGWDMTFGSIVQEINDRDDYDTETIRKLLDWNESPVPSLYSQKYSNIPSGTLAAGWDDIVAVPTPKPLFSYRIYSAYPISVTTGPSTTGGIVAHAYYLPLNGNRDNQPLATDLVENPYYDSEPDIFTANFLGHSIKFIRNPQNSQIIVLNKKGYIVTRTGDIYKIVVPSGTEYYFEQNSVTNSYAETIGGIGGNSSTNTLPSSRTWALTKIITRQKKQISFIYSQSDIVNNYPNYAEKWDTITNSISSALDAYSHASGYPYLAVNGISKTYSYSQEKRFHLTSIIFPQGQIDFLISDRNDVLGGKKLDEVQVKSVAKTVRTFQFNYSYFDATATGGNVFQPTNTVSYGNTSYLRLKLLSLQDNNGAIHSFAYNDNSLPAKNSLAQDFWGFYNGQLTNTSLIPNPARLNTSQLANVSGLADNGNNNSANLTHAQSAILTTIKYPTGGKVNFEYELNTFDNYWVPDFGSTSNQLSSGNGLRIHAITHRASNAISRRTVYSYSGGKSLQPVQMCRQYAIGSLQFYGGTSGAMTTHTIAEINARGFFSTNSLGSGNCVGYDKVTRQEVDANGISLGKTESYFNNRADDISSSATASSELNAALPTLKQISTSDPYYSDYPENGSLKKVLIFDNQNNLLSKTENNYTTFLSDIYYGARLFGYAALYFKAGTGSQYWASVPRTLTGYYPIFDIESLLANTTTTNYSGSNENVTTISYGYDSYRQIGSKQIRTSTDGYLEEEYEHAWNYYQRTGDGLLWNNNWLTEITRTRSIRRRSNYYENTVVSATDKLYSSIGDKIVINQITQTEHPGTNSIPSIITYDQFDSRGNPLQVTKNGKVSSILWDHTGTYIIGEIQNSTQAGLAYTSFEDAGKGNWYFTGPAMVASSAPTGKMAYSLTGYDISRSGLTPWAKYIVSYWKNGGTVLINGSTGLAGKSVDGWTYYEHKVNSPAGGTINVSGTGVIDELRLYPDKAFMTTYTFEPLIGMTSQSDIAGRITYYEYDTKGRLSIIRNQDKYILKRICYNYSGQPEDCNSSVYTNTTQTKTFTRNDCGTGYLGSTVIYTVSEESYTSTISQDDADQKALDDITANGQAYANQIGTCISSACNNNNCTGINKKCINNVCETGVRVCTSSVRDLSNKLWLNTFHYVWSDGSVSQNYQEYGPRCF